MRKSLLGVVCWACYASCAEADVAVTVRGDEAPSKLPWNEGAKLSHSKSGSGGSNASIDGVVKLSYIQDKPYVGGAYSTNFSGSVYWHKDSNDAKPRDDKGVGLSVGGMIYPDGDNAGGVFGWGWLANLKGGTTLKTTGSGASMTRYEADTDRQILDAQAFYQPALSGVPKLGGRSPITFFTANVGLYSDNARNSGNASLDGRVNGWQVKVGAVFAPFGTDPSLNKVSAHLGVAPVLRLSAQYQDDTSASGGRQPDSRHLYKIGLEFNFGKPDEPGLVPALVFERIIGADILTGMPYDTVNKVSLSFKFN